MRTIYFVAGALCVLLVEGVFVGGWAYGIPPEQPAVSVVQLERHMTFRVLAPKGYEEVGYVAFDCRPNIRKTVAKSGLHGKR